MTQAQIFDLIPKVMASVGEIGKGKKNTQQNYFFRGIDDALNFCGPAFAQYGITPSVIVKDHKLEVTDRGDKASAVRVLLTLTLRLTAPDASFIESTTVGEALDYGSDKATNKAMAAAMKYALFYGLALPVEAKNVGGGLDDSDFDHKKEAEHRPPANSNPKTPTPSNYQLVEEALDRQRGNDEKLAEMIDWVASDECHLTPEEKDRITAKIVQARRNLEAVVDQTKRNSAAAV